MQVMKYNIQMMHDYQVVMHHFQNVIHHIISLLNFTLYNIITLKYWRLMMSSCVIDYHAFTNPQVFYTWYIRVCICAFPGHAYLALTLQNWLEHVYGLVSWSRPFGRGDAYRLEIISAYYLLWHPRQSHPVTQLIASLVSQPPARKTSCLNPWDYSGLMTHAYNSEVNLMVHTLQLLYNILCNIVGRFQWFVSDLSISIYNMNTSLLPWVLRCSANIACSLAFCIIDYLL